MSKKWKFVEPFIHNKIKEAQEDQLSITKQEIADQMIEYFSLRIDRDHARKIVSNALNGKKLKASKETNRGNHFIHTSENIEYSRMNTDADFREVERGRWYPEDLKRILEEESNIVSKNTPRTPGVHIVTGCWHVPFEDPRTIMAFRKLLEDLGEDIVGFHLIGDFLDMNSLSGHDRKSVALQPGLDLNEEYRQGNRVLDSIDRLLPRTCVKTYLYGNHEDRYFRYIKEHENSKAPPISPTEALHLNERGYNVLERWADDYITLGDHLDLMHGVYFNVHCAKKHMDVFRGSVMFAHTHRIQTYIEGDTGSFNIGCMADIPHKAFDYATRAQKASWKQGFAVVHIDEEGDYFVNQIIINKHKFHYNGKTY